MDYRASRARHSDRTWLLLPGTAVALFAIVSIVLPIGSERVGAVGVGQCGLAPALARFSQDIHDGFWSRRAMALGLFSPSFDSGSEGWAHARRGAARDAIAAFQQTGLRDENDRQSLYDLLDRLVMDGNFDLAEWYVREADILLRGGGLRNNLAWHYTQVDIRPETALALALSSVTAERQAFNIDTLAWAYYRNGDLVHAIATAKETLEFSRPWLRGAESFDDQESKNSSLKLLTLISEETGQVNALDALPLDKAGEPHAARNPFAAR